MHSLDFDSVSLQQIQDGTKTVDVRLGTPQNLKLRLGDTVSLAGTDTLVTITQLLYFESLYELFSAISFANVMPDSTSAGQVIQQLRKHYSDTDEYEYCVMAITFALAG